MRTVRFTTAEGFTLVELVIATAISLIITGVLVTSLIVGLKNADGAGLRLSNSHDAQIAQSYFTTDAQSADLVDVSSSDPACAVTSGDTLLARFRWTVRPADPTTGVTYQAAAYATRASGGELQVVRQFCSGTVSFATASVVSTVVLIHGRDATTPPTVQCTSPKFTALGSCSTVSDSNPFETVRVTAQSTQKTTESSDTLLFVLSASRRSAQ